MIGLHSGVGVTLFVVQFAIYLFNKYKARVAVVGLNESASFEKAAYELSKREVGVIKTRINENKNIHFFSPVNDDLNGIDESQFDFVIYDLGIRMLRYRNMIDRCDQKIVIGSSLDWRRCEFEQFVSYVSHIDMYEKWEYLDVSGVRDKTVFVQEGKIKLKKVPWVESLDDLTEERVRLYESLL